MFSDSAVDAQVASHTSHEFVHRPAGVVAGHIVVAVLSSPCDPIRIGVEGRQKAKPDSVSPAIACGSDGLADGNLEVVSYEVDHCLSCCGAFLEPSRRLAK